MEEDGTDSPEEKSSRERSRSSSAASRDSDSVVSLASARSLLSNSMKEWSRPDIWSRKCEIRAEQTVMDMEVHFEETDDLFRSGRKFREKAKDLTARDWVSACGSLMNLDKRNQISTETMVLTDFCERCRKESAYIAAMNTTQLTRTRWALEEYARRYTRTEEMGREIAKEREELKEKVRRVEEERRGAELERDRLRNALDTVELERDRLRAALSTREDSDGGRGTPPPPTRDTEPEAMEMGEGVLSSPLGTPFPRPSLGPWRHGWRGSGSS